MYWNRFCLLVRNQRRRHLHNEFFKTAPHSDVSNFRGVSKHKRDRFRTQPDSALAARDYAVDAIWVNAFGMKRVGRAAIEATLKQVFGLDFVMAGESRTVEKEITFVRPDVALLTNRVERVGQKTAAGAEFTRSTSHLRVFVKSDVRWEIVNHLISDARSRGRAEH